MTAEKTMDRFFGTLGRALNTLCAPPVALRSPSQVLAEYEPVTQENLNDAERSHSAALMRINHVGEICAQALYEGHALSTADPELRNFFIQASREEADHLAWTKARIDQLGGRTSMLNPLWYGGAFAIGYLSGRFGDRTSLGFMRETERQVEAHLDSHLDKLPEGDVISRQILLAMKEDEAAHAESAARRGANELPKAVHWAMQASAKLMTKTAYHL